MEGADQTTGGLFALDREVEVINLKGGRFLVLKEDVLRGENPLANQYSFMEYESLMYDFGLFSGPSLVPDGTYAKSKSD